MRETALDPAQRTPPGAVTIMMRQLMALPADLLQVLDPNDLDRLARYGLHGHELLRFATILQTVERFRPVGESLRSLASQELDAHLLAFVDLEMDASATITEIAVVLRCGLRHVAAAEFTRGEGALVSHWLAGAVPGAHNGAAHDFPVLRQAGVMVPQASVDTLLWAQVAWPTWPSHALPGLARHAGVQIQERHSALPDALLLGDSFPTLLTACRGLPNADRAGIRESLCAAVDAQVLELMLGPDVGLAWSSTPAPGPLPTPDEETGSQRVVVVAAELAPTHLRPNSLVATLDPRSLHSSGLTLGWMLLAGRMIDGAELATGLAERGWPGAVAVRLLSEASGAICMWPQASAPDVESVPVRNGAPVCTGPGPWLTDTESLPEVAVGRPVVLDDAVALLLDGTGDFDPGQHAGPLTARVSHSGQREPAIVHLWQQILGTAPSFQGADPPIRWSTTLVTGMGAMSLPAARLARSAAIAAELAGAASTLLVTTTEQRRFVAGHLAAPWRQRTGKSLLRPGDWPTYPETLERIRRENHLVVTSSIGAVRVAAHLKSMVIDQLGTPRLDGRVFSRLLRDTVESGAEPYGDVVEPASALRLVRLLAHGEGTALLCDPRGDSPLVRRLLNAQGAWSSTHVTAFESGSLNTFVYGVLSASIPAGGRPTALNETIEHATTRLLGRDGTPRPFQSTVLRSLATGNDVLAVFRTGQGKSLCYQAFGLALADSGYGATLVISPLVALQRDQVLGLHRRGIWEATALNSDLHADVRQARLRGIAGGFYRLVYVAPEGLLSPSLRRAIGDAGLGAVAVDEAHCISEMGHDFRPDYRTLPVAIRRLMGLRDDAPLSTAARPRLMAFTGTASPAVREDIVAQLGGSFFQHVDSQFVRPELRFDLVRVPDAASTAKSKSSIVDPERLELLETTLDRTRLPAIIYTATRDEADRLAAHLTATRGVRAISYHADMNDGARRSAEEAFRSDSAEIICATNAFGMGVDKPNVRTVVHWRMPGSPEALYQEAGRAGRGPEGQPADCVVLFHPNDLELANRIRVRGVPIRTELEALWSTLLEFDSLQPSTRMLWCTDDDLGTLAGLRPKVSVAVCLAHLERAGLVKELDRVGASERVEVRPGVWPKNLTRVESAVLEHLAAHPYAQLSELLHALHSQPTEAVDDVDFLGLQAAIRGLRKRNLVQPVPPGAVLRALQRDPGEAVRQHLLLAHRALQVALDRKGRWADITPEKVGASLPKIIAAVETLAGFGLVQVSRARSVSSPPAILPNDNAISTLVRLGQLAKLVLAAALPSADSESRCDYGAVASVVGCTPVEVRKILVAAHHSTAIEMLPLDDGRTPGRSAARTFRLLQLADIADTSAALDAAEAAVRIRLERDQLRRMALEAYADLQSTDDEAHDVRQGFLERYFTDPTFLDDLRSVRVDRDIYSGLDDDQRQAVMSDHPRVAIIAGAGTGKTRTLTRRIAYRALSGGVLADQMLAVCFGREAASEMRERLAALGVHVPVRTLNSLGGSIVSDFWPVLGYRQKPTVMDEHQQHQLFRQALATLPALAHEVAKESQHLADISQAKSALTPTSRMMPLFKVIYEAYERQLFEACRIDFDDQFVKALEIMKDNDAARHVRGRIRELFVDEAQDLNPAQWQLLGAVGADARLTAVGDPRQAIYGFRGATTALFNWFSERPDTEMISLRYNYRSMPKIVETANRVVRERRLPELIPVHQDKGSLVPLRSAHDSALAKTVQDWLKKSIADDAIAVLARNGNSVQRASGLLRAAGIATQEVGIAPLHTTSAFRLISRLLPDAHTPGGELTIAESLADLFGRDDVQTALANAAAGSERDPADDWARVAAALADKELAGKVDVHEALAAVQSDSVANLGHESGIVVTTIHKAKGLEWDAVVLFDIDAESFRGSDDDSLLLYVAITRARRHLVVMSGAALAKPMEDALR